MKVCTSLILCSVKGHGKKHVKSKKWKIYPKCKKKLCSLHGNNILYNMY